MNWQPIETAPIDEWVLIAATPDHVGQAIVYDDADINGNGSDARRYEWAFGSAFHPNHKPTHWMPLPTHPSPAIAELQPDLQRSLLLLRTLLLKGGEVESPAVIRSTVEEVISLIQRNVVFGAAPRCRLTPDNKGTKERAMQDSPQVNVTSDSVTAESLGEAAGAPPKRGVVVLRNAIALLREEACYRDDEGEDTDALDDLLAWLTSDPITNLLDELAALRQAPLMAASVTPSDSPLSEA